MDESLNTVAPATSEGQEQELEINLDEPTAEEVVATLKAQLAEKEALLAKEAEARRQLTARAKDAESKISAPRLEEKHDDIRSTVAELKLAETKRQFGYEHGLSPEETDFVFKINGKPTKEALDDVAIKGALQAIRGQKKVAGNTPRASRSSGFTLPTKKTPLTADEKQEAFDKAKREKMGE